MTDRINAALEKALGDYNEQWESHGWETEALVVIKAANATPFLYLDTGLVATLNAFADAVLGSKP